MEDLVFKLNKHVNNKSLNQKSSKRVDPLDAVKSFQLKRKISHNPSWLSSHRPCLNNWNSVLERVNIKTEENSHDKCKFELQKLFPSTSSDQEFTFPEISDKLSLENSKVSQMNKKIDFKEFSDENKEISNLAVYEKEINEIDDHEDPTIDEIVANLQRVKEVAHELSKHIPVYEKPHKDTNSQDIFDTNSHITKQIDSLRSSFRNQSFQINKSFHNSLKVENNISSPQTMKTFTENSLDNLDNTIYHEDELSNIPSQKGFYYKLKSNSQAFKLHDPLFKSQKAENSLNHRSGMNKNYLEMQKIKLEEIENQLIKQRFIL